MKRAHLATAIVLFLVSMAIASVLLAFWSSKPNIEYSIDYSSREFYPNRINMISVDCTNRAEQAVFM